MTDLYLYNTLTRTKERFEPRDAKNVRMYVCGPTVYDRAHIGNARSVVVYDVLFRLLKQLYGAQHVTYARNITDVDDKINAAARQRGITIQALTEEVTGWFHADMAALNVLPASGSKGNGLMVEPKATQHIGQMVDIIERLINNGHAYVAEGHVLFEVASAPLHTSPRERGEDQGGGYCYGILSGRIQDDLEAGARVKVESYKRAAGDFVLWKPADAEDDPSSLFDSPWGKGRPGWHIECSAMSHTHLGDDFDIHGGGADLMFPHHENEIAQSRCAFPESSHARYWVHNGFLTVNGEKMSKSLGNFITVRDLLDKGVKGEVIRWALLSTNYNKPLDWNDKLIEDSKKLLDYAYRALKSISPNTIEASEISDFDDGNPRPFNVLYSLCDDLNTAEIRATLDALAGSVLNTTSFNPEERRVLAIRLKSFGKFLGILQQDPESWFKGDEDDGQIQSLIDARVAAKKAKNWAEADKIRNELKLQGILLEDKPDGSTDWRRE